MHVTGNWPPVMTRWPSITIAIVLAPSAEFWCSAERWSSRNLWPAGPQAGIEVFQVGLHAVQVQYLPIDRDLPSAYGSDGGRLDRGGPKVFPSSKASKVMMWCGQTLLLTLGKSKRSAFHFCHTVLCLQQLVTFSQFSSTLSLLLAERTDQHQTDQQCAAQRVNSDGFSSWEGRVQKEAREDGCHKHQRNRGPEWQTAWQSMKWTAKTQSCSSESPP